MILYISDGAGELIEAACSRLAVGCTELATTAAAGMAKMMMRKKKAIAVEDDAGVKETTSAADVLAVISRLVGRPFLGADASKKLEKLENMLTTEAVLQTIQAADHRLLESLNAALREAEATLDDVEHRHLCLQGLIVAHHGEKRNPVSKLLLERRCSRMKNKLEKRRRKAESIISEAHRQVKSVTDVDSRKRIAIVRFPSASSKMAK